MSIICYVSIIVWLCIIWIGVNNVKSDIEKIKIQCKHLSEMQELLCKHIVKNTDILIELIDDIMEIERKNEHNNQI